MTKSELLRRTRLFIISYTPLAWILAIQNVDTDAVLCVGWAAISFALLGLFGLIDAYRLPRISTRKNRIVARLENLSDTGGEVAAYVATYILPFASPQVDGWRDIAVMAIYVAVIFAVYIRSNLALVNPTLYVFGYRVVSATWDRGPRYGKQRVMLLTKSHTSISDGEYPVSSFGQFLVARIDGDTEGQPEKEES